MQRGDAGFSSDGKGIYVLSSIDDVSRGIYYYDIETKMYTPALMQTDGFINNFISSKTFEHAIS